MTADAPLKSLASADETQSGAGVQRDEIIRRIGLELAELSNDLRRFQHDISELLEQARVSSDLSQRIQGLDDSTQRLHALSRVAEALSSDPFDTSEVSLAELESLVPLGALRNRLLSDDTKTGSERTHFGHVNLF